MLVDIASRPPPLARARCGFACSQNKLRRGATVARACVCLAWNWGGLARD